jgi:hypothetical protein
MLRPASLFALPGQSFYDRACAAGVATERRRLLLDEE